MVTVSENKSEKVHFMRSGNKKKEKNIDSILNRLGAKIAATSHMINFE